MAKKIPAQLSLSVIHPNIEYGLVNAYEKEMGFAPRNKEPKDPGYGQWILTMNSRKGVKDEIESAKYSSSGRAKALRKRGARKKTSRS